MGGGFQGYMKVNSFDYQILATLYMRRGDDAMIIEVWKELTRGLGCLLSTHHDRGMQYRHPMRQKFPPYHHARDPAPISSSCIPASTA